MLAGAVAKLAAGTSLEAAAQAICDELCSLPAVDFAAVGAFVPDDGALILAASAVDGGSAFHVGFHLPANRSDALRELAGRGPWADDRVCQPEDGEWGRDMDRAGLAALAFGPIVHGAHVDGGVVIGTRDPAFGRSLVEKWASLIDFSTTPMRSWRNACTHARWRSRCGDRSPIPSSAGPSDPSSSRSSSWRRGEIVGHEALTRFATEPAT